jgi:hypothetical protein
LKRIISYFFSGTTTSGAGFSSFFMVPNKDFLPKLLGFFALSCACGSLTSLTSLTSSFFGSVTGAGSSFFSIF